MYDKIFSKIYDEYGWDYFSLTMGKSILDYFKVNNIIIKNNLDLCCGTGVLCDYFYKNNLKEFTIEVNPEDIEKEKIENNKNQKIDLDWINKIKAVGKIDELNKFIVNEFIDNIYVTENRNIKIDFKFDDQYEDLIKYLKSQKIMI